MTLKAIEALVSIIFFSNKVGMLVGKKLGWVLGAIGALLSIVYFYFLDLRVYMLAATYLLHPKNGIWKIKWGWTILAATHLGAAYIGYAKNQPMFPHYQIASAIVGVFGALKRY